MQLDARQIIIRPIISEQSYDQAEDGVYTFEVAKQANKIQIAKAIEQIFNVKVMKVNTLNVKPKMKRVRYKQGATRTWKKAFVTLAEGENIEVFSS